MFRARAAQMSEGGTIVIQTQSVTMDLRTGRLSVSEIRNLSDDEIRRELR